MGTKQRTESREAPSPRFSITRLQDRETVGQQSKNKGIVWGLMSAIRNIISGSQSI